MDTSNMKLMVFRPPIAMEDSELFEKVYRFWYDCWKTANVEMGKPTTPPSEQLTRQHEILVLFKDNEPIASVCHRFADLKCPSTYRDSYFLHSWSEKETSYLMERGGLGILGSQITVHRDYRKSVNGYDTKFLISFLSLQHTQNLEVDVVLGMMRVDKGMEKVFYQAGAKKLAEKAPYFGAEVDLVAFYPKIEPIQIPEQYKLDVTRLLKNARFFQSLNVSAQTRRAA